MVNKHIFFTDELGSGGISTNIVALAGYMATIDSKVAIVPIKARRNGVVDYCEKFSEIISPLNFARLVKKNNREDYVFLINSVRTLIAAYLIIFFSLPKNCSARIIYCVYNPMEFAQGGLWSALYRRLILTLGEENIVFMNGACYEHHAAICAVGSVKPKFLPLVHPKLFSVCQGALGVNRKTVLTVARFVGFKMHYLRALLRYARQRPDFDFYFVGYGEGELELKQFSDENELKNVYFLGKIEYKELNKLYQNADCYVGMGTTLVEASSVGTPGIVAIAGVPGDVCYGLFLNQSEYDMGEFRKNKPLLPIFDQIDYVLNLNEENFNSLCELHKVFSNKFDADVVGCLYLQLCQSISVTNRRFTTWIIFCAFLLTSVVYYFGWILTGKNSRYDRPCL